MPDGPALDPEAAAALAFVPLARELMDYLRGRLPAGTDFGLMILVPGHPEGRVVAMTTNRAVVARAVGLWVIDALGAQTGQDPPARRCTGVAAVWCPVCGTCTCQRDAEGHRTEEVPECRLHGVGSTHGGL